MNIKIKEHIDGTDLITITNLLVHSSIKITEIYLDSLPEKKLDSTKLMDFILN